MDRVNNADELDELYLTVSYMYLYCTTSLSMSYRTALS